MRIIHIILLLSIIIGACMLAIATAPSAENALGKNHETIERMRQGGDGQARIKHIANYAWVMQAASLALIVVLAGLGVAESKRSPMMWACLALMYCAYLFVWWNIFSSYQQTMKTGDTGFVLGLPTATAWTVYATWLTGSSLVLFYSLGFRKLIYSEEDEKAYEELLKEFAPPASESIERES